MNSIHICKKTMTVVLIFILISTLVILPNSAKADDAGYSPIGYTFPNPLVDEAFTAKPTNVALSVNDATKVKYDYTNNGLAIKYNTTAGSVYITNTEAYSDTVRFVINPSAIDSSHFFQIVVDFSIKSKPSYYYQEVIQFYSYQIKLQPEYWLGAGSQDVKMIVMPYPVEAKDLLDIVVSVREGKVICSVDGLDNVHDTDYKIYKDLAITNISLSSTSIWNSPGQIYLKKLQIGQNTQTQYHDRLHKTTTPWGYDFSLSMQIHADYATPSQLLLMKELADTYGIKGEFDAWVNVANTSTNYGIATSQDYLNAILALKASGWDIGLHAVNNYDTNRTEMLADIAIFERYFGPLESWTDHGNMSQDIHEYGNNISSNYYIADYLVNNGVQIWVNNVSQSHSKYDDLNYEGAYYTNPDYPGLDLERTSREGVLGFFDDWSPDFGPVNKSDFDIRLRSYADERSVLMWHDYTYRFLYVQDGSKAYAFINESDMGYPYVVITTTEREEYGSNVHPNGTWEIMPAVGYLFESMKDSFKVWYATAQEIYDRSKLVQSVDFTETSSNVDVTNHNTQSVDGLTLYMKSQPTFYLKLNNVSCYPQKGTESWSFVIDSLPPNTTYNLTKVSLPIVTPSISIDAILAEIAPYVTLLVVVATIEIVYITIMRRRQSAK